MMRSIFSLVLQGIFRKRRSSLLIFSVLLVSFSFAIGALSLMGSIAKTNAEFRLNTYGQWYFAIPSGMEEDRQWLEDQPWVEKMGVSCQYGHIATPSGLAGFGTVDEALVELGRIRLDEGRFPAEDGEIAMEADVLGALGYDYRLGQQVTLTVSLPYKDQLIPIERTFTLCGILHEYSNLWTLNRNSDSRLPVSAMVTDGAAEEILEAARQCITMPENRPLVAPVPQYFLAVAEEDRADARQSLNGWMSATRTGDFGDFWPCENITAYPGTAAREYDNVYVYIIAAVTMIAVLCVYLMQMSREIRSFTVLRSVGMTKPQLALLVLAETMLLILPAIVLGIPGGAGLTWLGLRLMLYSGSVDIQVEIPYDALGLVIGLWAAAVLVSRLAVFAVTVRSPLTGRMGRKNQRQIGFLRGTLILLLAGAFGGVTVYTGMEALDPERDRTYWSLCPAYTIWGEGTVSRTDTELMKQVPGVARVDGFGEMEIDLSFEGFPEQTVWIYSIDETGWKESLDFEGVEDAFHDGEVVLMCFPEVSEFITAETVTLSVYNSEGTPMVRRETEAVIREISEDAMNRGLHAFYEPYTIFCSEAFLQQLLDTMEPGQRWDKYVAGEPLGYDRVYVGVDLNSDYLSTDVAMAELCKEKGLSFDNRREQFQSMVQENVQTLILLYSAGLCIGIVVLLILASTLSLEAEREKRKFTILGAIGMSRRQRNRRIFGKAMGRSMAALVLGWGLYAAVGRGLAWDWQRALTVSGLALLVPLAVSLLAKRSLLKGELML